MCVWQGKSPEVFVLRLLLVVGCVVSFSWAQSSNSGSASSTCNPSYSPASPNLCLRDSSKLQACSKRLTSIIKDSECKQQRSLWNCAWHHLRAEDCKGLFPLVRSLLPAQCKEASTSKDNVESTTPYGTRGLSLWLSCVSSFSSCDNYWSCNSLDTFKACVANARKLFNPRMLSTFNTINSLMESIHQRVRCFNSSSESVFPFDFKACLFGVTQQALSHISSMAKYDPAISVVTSKTQGPVGCMSAERLEQNLNKMHKDCPIFLQKYDRPSFQAIRDIFETLLPEAEGERCFGGSTDTDYKPVQMSP